MSRLLYLSHPEVRIDPDRPVPDWGLSPKGAARVADWVARGLFGTVARVVSSAERKALNTARPLAAAAGCPVEIRPGMHENDRAATGFLPPAEFETVADAFFADPDLSARGWERAVDAQRRIVAETEAVLAGHQGGDLLLVGHGAVGTLLWCHLTGRAICRSEDQPAGGGNLWAVALPGRRALHGWSRCEALYPGA